MEGEEDFFIYLNSEFDRTEYKNNSVSGFTNIIRRNLNLNGRYEVGLRNVIFNPDFYVVKKNDREFGINVGFHFNNKEDEYVGGIEVDYTPTYNVKANIIDEFIRKIDRDFVSVLKKSKIIDLSDHRIFTYDLNDKVIEFKPIKLDVNRFLEEYDKIPYSDGLTFKVLYTIGGKLSKALGIEKPDFIGEPDIANPPIMPNLTHMLYIYSDIVSNSYMGGHQVNLLDVFPLKNSYAKTSNLTMYKTLSTQNLDTISIKITDQNGLEPKLSDHVSIILVLHFKRIFD